MPRRRRGALTKFNKGEGVDVEWLEGEDKGWWPATITSVANSFAEDNSAPVYNVAYTKGFGTEKGVDESRIRANTPTFTQTFF